MFDPQQIDNVLQRRAIGGGRRKIASVKQVLAHGQVRQKPRVLENVADPALVPRHEHAMRRVDQRLAIERNTRAVGPDETRQDIDDRSLAGAGLPEEGHQPRPRRELRIEREVVQPVPDIHLQHHWISRRC